VAYHLVNILLHAASACFVVAIMRRLMLPGAWLAGFIFALHPVNVESVAWISEQKNTLSTVLCLASAYVYLGFDRERRSGQYALALGLFALALLTKTVTSTLPAALLIIVFWRRGELGWRRDIVPLSPWLALGLTAGLFTAWMERTYVGAQGADFALSLTERFQVAGRAIWFYLAKLVWPVNLVFIYPRWKVDATETWQYLFPFAVLTVVLVLSLAAMSARGSHRPVATGAFAGFLIFTGTLFPALGFFNVFPFIYSYVADHFQYLASLGIIVPVAAGLALGSGPLLARAATRLVPLIGAAVLVSILGLLTWFQSGIYRDLQTLYLATLKGNPGCWMAHVNLGLVWSQTPGRIDDAIAQYEEALLLKPNYAEAHNDLGNAWSQMPSKRNDAVAQFEEALRLMPVFPEAHYNLGIALSTMPGRLNEAADQFQMALQQKPDFTEAHYNLGNVLSRIPGRMNDAIFQFKEALRLEPDSVQGWHNLGTCWFILGNFPAATSAFREELRLAPSSPTAQQALSATLQQTEGTLRGN
jgi:cytochrome c-type biogenesis protein CcmH/NrfG